MRDVPPPWVIAVASLSSGAVLFSLLNMAVVVVVVLDLIDTM